MSIGLRIANLLGVLVVGEPLSPIRWPRAEWELREPRVESDANSETLVLRIRDREYPRLRGTVSIKLVSGHTMVRWKTRASGGGFAADRLIRISDDGYLSGPMLLGHLSCDDSEMKRVRAFLERQARPDRDEADPLLVAVPQGPIRPRGGLTGEASPEE